MSKFLSAETLIMEASESDQKIAPNEESKPGQPRVVYVTSEEMGVIMNRSGMACFGNATFGPGAQYHDQKSSVIVNGVETADPGILYIVKP